MNHARGWYHPTLQKSPLETEATSPELPAHPTNLIKDSPQLNPVAPCQYPQNQKSMAANFLEGKQLMGNY